MSLLEFLTVLRKRWLYALVPVILGIGGAAGISLVSTPIYKSSADVYLSLPYASSASDLFQGSNYTQKQLASFAALATTPVVLSPVIDKLALDTTPQKLAGQVTPSASNDTVIISLAVADPSAERAAQIADAIASQLGVVVRELAPRNQDGTSAIDVRTVQQAVIATSPSSPKTTRNLGAGALAGLFFGVLLAIARDRFDTRVRVGDTSVDVPALVTIAMDKTAHRRPLLIGEAGRSSRAESFRQLRTNVQFLDVDNPVQVLVITSAVAGEGKSSTSANLAIICAETGRRVVLIEADLRRPRASDYLDLERSVGLTTVLAGQATLDEALQRWGDHGLMVLPSGTVPPNPSELLGSQHMSQLLTDLRARFDLVVIDTPPVLPVTDAAVVAAEADGAMVVVRCGKTKRAQLQRAVQALRAVDARVLGTVLNMAPAKGIVSYEYEYQYLSAPSATLTSSSGTESRKAGPTVDAGEAEDAPVEPGAVQGDAAIEADGVVEPDGAVQADDSAHPDAGAQPRPVPQSGPARQVEPVDQGRAEPAAGGGTTVKKSRRRIRRGG